MVLVAATAALFGSAVAMLAVAALQYVAPWQAVLG
jgi:hypothetical protein